VDLIQHLLLTYESFVPGLNETYNMKTVTMNPVNEVQIIRIIGLSNRNQHVVGALQPTVAYCKIHNGLRLMLFEQIK